MIDVAKIKTYNWDGAIIGMRNPMKSWGKIDSTFFGSDGKVFIMGESDLKLARKLCQAGSDHRKFLRQIFVSMEILAPLYWWKEFDTYKVGTCSNSTSTMHTLANEPLTLEDFSIESLGDEDREAFYDFITQINICLEDFRSSGDMSRWRNAIQMLPSSYNQFRTVTMNYEVLRNMYFSRRDHKLSEWREFCKVIEDMPYFRELFL